MSPTDPTQEDLSRDARATRRLPAPLTRMLPLYREARSATNAMAGGGVVGEADPEAVLDDPSWLRGVTLEGGSDTGEEYQRHHTVETPKTQADAGLPTSGIFLARRLYRTSRFVYTAVRRLDFRASFFWEHAAISMDLTATSESSVTTQLAPNKRRSDIRNIAIIAHVDHGKTTLVDAVLRQTHVHRKIDDMGERIMDSMDQERERGITIRDKNASVTYNGVKINIVDTPGHADFGGEVERTLRMVDGVLILVDAKEGPMPQTTFVLRKALALGHKAIVVINKIDRPDAVIDDVVNRTFDLFVNLGAKDDQLDFPIIYASAVSGQASLDSHKPGTDLVPLFQTIVDKIPGPTVAENEPLQILVLALAYDSYKGKLGIGKISAGTIKKGQSIMQIAPDGTKLTGRATDIMVFAGLQKISIEEASAGEIVSVAGLEEITIGSTITDPTNPKQIDPVTVDEPTVQM